MFIVNSVGSRYLLVFGVLLVSLWLLFGLMLCCDWFGCVVFGYVGVIVVCCCLLVVLFLELCYVVVMQCLLYVVACG